MFDYKLDTTMLPTIWVTWASTKNGAFNKRYWLNCKTGKKKESPEKWMYYPDEEHIDRYRYRYSTKGAVGIYWWNRNENKFWVKSGTKVRFAYLKYHKREDVLEVAVVGIDTTRKAEPHNWKYLGERYFIRRDKTIVNKNGNTCRSYELYDCHTAWNPNVMFSMLNRLNYNDFAINEFKKFIGSDSFIAGSYKTINIEYLYHLQDWYKVKQKTITKTNGSAQQMVDSLTSISLSDISDKIIAYYNEQNYGNASYFERIDDEWSVLRIFTSRRKETYRMYLSDDGKNRFAMYTTSNGWVAANVPPYKYNYSHFINKDEGVGGCRRIKYAMDALDGVNDCYLVNCLLAVLKIPDLEQLSKLGGKEAVKNLVMDTYPKAELKHWAGEYYNEKEKNLLRRIGLNKNQLDYYISSRYSESYNYYQNALEEMREWFGKDLSHVDIATFKKYLDGLEKVKHNMWYYSRVAIREFGLEYKKFIKNLIRLGEKNEQTYRLASDTLSSARGLNTGTMPQIDWYFDDYSDLVRAHDAVVALKAAQDAERRAYWSMSEAERMKKEEEKRQKIDAERKQYEYEDDVYIIRLPKDLTEIVNEGAKQSICIGGYTSRHANGNTNLFFLREKSSPDKPFYAIEMGNDKSIVQIHGYCNQWLGNHPDAIPTVIRWLRKNGITCNDRILTCTAKGYSGTSNYVPMPVVD